MNKIRIFNFIVLAVAGSILATLFFYAVPVWIFEYHTRLDFPSFLSNEEKQRLTKERENILKMENKGPNNALVYNDIGILRSGYGDYAGAIEAFKRARLKDPQDARFSRNMAIAYTNLNDFVHAEEAFREAFRLAPTQPAYWLELGELYTFKLNDKEKARLFYIEALGRTNNNLDVVKKYANFLTDIMRDYAEAIKYWQILADNDEQNKIAYIEKIEELQKRLKPPTP